jgi:branched-chain amino acid transport system permease protein
MEIVIQIIVTGLTMGSMYALAAVGLSLIYGTLGMFNMAHGMFMTLGAYAVFTLSSVIGLPLILGIAVAMAAGALIGMATHLVMVRFMLTSPEFETNILVATAGLAIVLEDLVLKSYGGYPYPQPVRISGNMMIGGVAVTYQAMVILAVAAICIGAVA